MTEAHATRRALAAVVLLVACGTAPIGVGAPAALPDRAATRHAIDQMIAEYRSQRRPATLGLLHSAIQRSIEYGAPAFNLGDKEGCYRFYERTASSLIEAFGNSGATSRAALQAVEALRAALPRASGFDDADRKAWTMRFAFDRVILDWRMELAHNASLIALGDQYFHRSQFDEAALAFGKATEVLDELAPHDLTELPLDNRLAPLALGHALFTARRFHESAEAIARGLEYVPEWLELRIDRRGFYANPADYDRALAAAEAALAQRDDARLHFLLGYEYGMTGRLEEATHSLERVLELDPEHRGARRLLDQLGKAPAPALKKGLSI